MLKSILEPGLGDSAATKQFSGLRTAREAVLSPGPERVSHCRRASGQLLINS